MKDARGASFANREQLNRLRAGPHGRTVDRGNGLEHDSARLHAEQRRGRTDVAAPTPMLTGSADMAVNLDTTAIDESGTATHPPSAGVAALAKQPRLDRLELRPECACVYVCHLWGSIHPNRAGSFTRVRCLRRPGRADGNRRARPRAWVEPLSGSGTELIGHDAPNTLHVHRNKRRQNVCVRWICSSVLPCGQIYSARLDAAWS